MRLDAVMERERALINRIAVSEAYTFELEHRLEALEAVINNMLQYEHPQVQDAVAENIQVVMRNPDHETSDLERLLDEYNAQFGEDWFDSIFEEV